MRVEKTVLGDRPHNRAESTLYAHPALSEITNSRGSTMNGLASRFAAKSVSCWG